MTAALTTAEALFAEHMDWRTHVIGHVPDVAGSVKDRVLRIIAESGQLGVTDVEGQRIYDELYLAGTSPKTFARKRSELSARRQVRADGLRLNPSGKSAIIWKAVV